MPTEPQLLKRVPGYKELTFTHRGIFRYLLAWMQKTGECIIRQEEVAEQVGCHRREVIRAAHRFRALHLVDSQPTKDERGGHHHQHWKLTLKTRAVLSCDRTAPPARNLPPFGGNLRNTTSEGAHAARARSDFSRPGERGKRSAWRGPPGRGLLSELRAILAARELGRADHATLRQVADLCPREHRELALRAARSVARWEDCRAIGAGVRRKLVGLLAAAGAELPEQWRGVSYPEFQQVRDTEKGDGPRPAPAPARGAWPAAAGGLVPLGNVLAEALARAETPPDPNQLDLIEPPQLDLIADAP